MDLKECRIEIDRIDKQLVQLLEERMNVAGEVIRYKERKALPILDSGREGEKLDALACLCSEDALPYIRQIMKDIMQQSRKYQDDHRMKYGLLGKTLGHSHSPLVHRMLGGYEYGLFERDEEQLEAFLEGAVFKGINVTIPYKRAVIPYCSELSERARACSSVNTIINRDGQLYGDNTDYAGLRYVIEQSGIEVCGKALVFGSGGVSGTAKACLADMGADPVVIISRSGENNYQNLDRHADAQIIVNATPCGMYPNAGVSAADISQFPGLRAVYDLIYNPLRTKLMLDAERLGIPAFGGLAMLVAQAAEGCRLFTGQEITAEKTAEVIRQLQNSLEHIILIGMPGCGKTTVGEVLAKRTGRTFIDLDDAIRDGTGRRPEEIIVEDGRDIFRRIETETLWSILREGLRPGGEEVPRDASGGGIILAAGGGIVEREENRDLLRENGRVIYVKRPLDQLPSDGRPVSQADGVAAVYERRRERYESWSDLHIDNTSPEEAAEKILAQTGIGTETES